jgi:hypothetical protein
VSEKKPEFFAPPRKTCPICGKVSYSLAGIHPQCAQKRADEAIRVKLKAAMPAHAKAVAK